MRLHTVWFFYNKHSLGNSKNNILFFIAIISYDCYRFEFEFQRFLNQNYIKK